MNKKTSNYTCKSLLLVLSMCLMAFMQAFANQPLDTLGPLAKLNKQFLIVAHVVIRENKTLVVDTPTVRSLIGKLNSTFEPAGISFMLCGIRLIDNSNFEVLDNTIGEFQTLQFDSWVPERINLYFVRSLEGFPSVMCSYSTGTMASISPSGIFISCPEAGSMAHEFGHFFGLSDTFSKNADELVNGSNCSLAGDYVCDTPADPFKEGSDLRTFISPNCTFVYTGKDANNHYYMTDTGNPMSFYTNCRCQRFSHGQYERIIQFYQNNRTSW